MNYSAFFKGDAVTIALYVAPGDNNITIQLEEMIVGDWVEWPEMPACDSVQK